MVADPARGPRCPAGAKDLNKRMGNAPVRHVLRMAKEPMSLPETTTITAIKDGMHFIRDNQINGMKETVSLMRDDISAKNGDSDDA